MMLRTTRAFTLVELMTSVAVLVVLLLILFSMVGQTGQILSYTTGKVEQFREARNGFEAVSRRLSQATLNTYWDYRYNSQNVPEKYERKSELRFICGPMEDLVKSSLPRRPTHGVFLQAPLGRSDVMTANGDAYRGMDSLLNTWGCFVEFGDDRELRPGFLSETSPALRYRCRLFEMIVPSEQLAIYNPAAKDAAWNGWFADPLATKNRPVHVLAENIVALVLLPRLAAAEEREREKLHKPMLAANYGYDSTNTKVTDPEINPKNQLPPALQVTMVAIDEASAGRLAARFGKEMPDFKTDALFRDATKLEDDRNTPAPGDGDLGALQSKLTELRVGFRVFTATVSIKGAKWSRAQTN